MVILGIDPGLATLGWGVIDTDGVKHRIVQYGAILTTPGEALDMQEIDVLGLDRTDRAMLETMIRKFGGGPVGLDTLAAITGEDGSTIEDVYEPYLLQLGFIMRTPRGRVATPPAYEHLGLTAPLPPVDGAQIKLDI